MSNDFGRLLLLLLLPLLENEVVAVNADTVPSIMIVMPALLLSIKFRVAKDDDSTNPIAAESDATLVMVMLLPRSLLFLLQLRRFRSCLREFLWCLDVLLLPSAE